MSGSKKYVVEMGWDVLFRDLNISPQDVLRQAQLPLDLLIRKPPMLTIEEYFRLWDALEHFLGVDPAFPVTLGQSVSVEAFSPPVFASFCSPNLNVALNRLAYYKPLVAPMKLNILQQDDQTIVAVNGLPENPHPPAKLLAMDLVFFVHLARLATREQIVPLTVRMAEHVPAIAVYEDFFGTKVQHGDYFGVSFTAPDARMPFLTANDNMWSIFEPELNVRLKDLTSAATFSDRVRASLMETLASGQYAIDDIAKHLAMSPRTLQRRLRDEDTTFQKELDTLHEELARNYLTRSDYTTGQIAFLLGYQDPNSFFRAFRGWTGQTPDLVRSGQSH